jgi:hypothetical protein
MALSFLEIPLLNVKDRSFFSAHTVDPLDFAMIKPTYKIIAMQVFRFSQKLHLEHSNFEQAMVTFDP